MSNREKVAQREKEGRDAVINAWGNVHQFTESPYQFDSWDLSGQTQSIDKGERNFFLEIKTRDMKSTAKETAFLENLKFNLLRDVANRYKADMFYVSIYYDCGYIWNIRKIKLEDISIDTQRVPIEMCVEDGQPIVYEDKIFIELPFKKGQRFELKK